MQQEGYSIFSIVLRSADEVLYRRICRLADVEGTDRITVFCPLSSENLHVKDYKEITASLRAFGREMASFWFSRTGPSRANTCSTLITE